MIGALIVMQHKRAVAVKIYESHTEFSTFLKLFTVTAKLSFAQA